jgi:hypothetical protein
VFPVDKVQTRMFCKFVFEVWLCVLQIESRELLLLDRPVRLKRSSRAKLPCAILYGKISQETRRYFVN